MKVVVLNGSPNGNQSVSLQYFHYIRKHFPQNDYHVFNIGLNFYNKSDKDNSDLTDKIREADLILWVFPVYFFNVPSQMKSFIEAIFSSDLKAVFNGKYVSCITSSIKISDVTAHKYIHVISEFLEMTYIEGYSAERSDIFLKNERKRILNFATLLFKSVDEKIISFSRFSFPLPTINILKTEDNYPSDEKTEVIGQTLILYHSGIFENETQKIFECFQNNLKSSFVSADLAEHDFKPCSGCFKCGYSNECNIKDGFLSLFNDYIKKSDNLIFIIPAKDAFIASEWKAFFDRMFFNNHVQILKGVSISYVLYGHSINKDLTYSLLEMFAVSQGAILTDILYLENPESEINFKISSLLKKIKLTESVNYQKPLSFYNIAFEKIIKSYVKLDLAPVFYADSIYFRNKLSPKKFFVFVYMFFRYILISFLFLFPALRRIFYKNINPYTIKKMSKIIEMK